MSCRLAPSTTIAIGMPFASVNKLRLTPPLPRSVGLRPVFFPAQWGLRHRTIHGQPRLVNSIECINGQKPQATKFLEDAGIAPLLEPSVCRTA
jgi:hypothetical protein